MEEAGGAVDGIRQHEIAAVGEECAGDGKPDRNGEVGGGFQVVIGGRQRPA